MCMCVHSDVCVWVYKYVCACVCPVYPDCVTRQLNRILSASKTSAYSVNKDSVCVCVCVQECDVTVGLCPVVPL